jgi:pimeloyl-ACP methyl ester carboxylesterase
MPSASVGAATLYYERIGESGDPAILVHGSWVDHHSFDAIVAPLAQGLQVLTYDRRGHGQSSGPLRTHPVRDDAQDLAGLLEALDLYPVHLVAHSYGGAVAFRLATDRPEMVRSIAVHEAPFAGLLEDDAATAGEAERLFRTLRDLQDSVRRGDSERAARGVTDAFSVQEGAWDRLPPPVQATFLRHATRWCEEYDDPEALRPELPELADLLLPVLLTQGELSPPFLHRITTALSLALRNATVLTLPEAGHVPQVTHPLSYAGLLGTFLLERNVPVT